MKKKTLTRGLLAAAVLAGGVAAAVPVGAQTGTQGCPLGALCLYEDIAFGGPLVILTRNSSYVGDDINNRASSVFNNTDLPVILYSERDFAGFSICLLSGMGFGNLDTVGLDNTISSWKKVNNC